VVNIAEAVEVFELSAAAGPPWSDLREGYEAALSAFERKDFRRTAQGAGNLLQTHPDDGPCLALLSRAVNLLVDRAETFDPIWELPGK
jgi:hypothetical protein